MRSCAVGDFSWLWTGSAPSHPLRFQINLKYPLEVRTFQDREPGLAVDNSEAVTPCLDSLSPDLDMSPLTPELWLKSHVSQTEPGMWKCGYCDGIHHVPRFLEMMAPLPPTNSPRCDPEMSLQKTDCCHIQQSADFSKELHHLVESLVYKLLGWAQSKAKYKCRLDIVLGSDLSHVDS